MVNVKTGFIFVSQGLIDGEMDLIRSNCFDIASIFLAI